MLALERHCSDSIVEVVLQDLSDCLWVIQTTDLSDQTTVFGFSLFSSWEQTDDFCWTLEHGALRATSFGGFVAPVPAKDHVFPNYFSCKLFSCWKKLTWNDVGSTRRRNVFTEWLNVSVCECSGCTSWFATKTVGWQTFLHAFHIYIIFGRNQFLQIPSLHQVSKYQ